MSVRVDAVVSGLLQLLNNAKRKIKFGSQGFHDFNIFFVQEKYLLRIYPRYINFHTRGHAGNGHSLIT
jgi:hypothetical protein